MSSVLSRYQQPFSEKNVLRFFSFSLLLLTCFLKLSILSKVTPSILTLDFNGIGELLIVRCGTKLVSLLQVVNTIALDFSAHKLTFLDSSQSCEVTRYAVTMPGIFQPVG